MDLSDEVYVLHGANVDGSYLPTLPIAAADIEQVGSGGDMSKGDLVSLLAGSNSHHQMDAWTF